MSMVVWLVAWWAPCHRIQDQQLTEVALEMPESLNLDLEEMVSNLAEVVQSSQEAARPSNQAGAVLSILEAVLQSSQQAGQR